MVMSCSENAVIIALIDVLVLGYCGGSHAAEPYLMISQIATAYYFAHFLIILPLISTIEKPLPLPGSITEAVLAKARHKTGTADAVAAE